MSPQAMRTLRRALLATLVVVSGAVALSLRRPTKTGAPERPPAPMPSSGASFSEGIYRSFQEGRERFAVKFKVNVGEQEGAARLRGVEVKVPGTREGKPATTTILADEALYDLNAQKASFSGHVRVTTEGGLELATESLDYDVEKRRAETRDPVEFKRGRLSGRARGMGYDAREAGVELRSDAFLRLESESGPPAEIRSARAAWAGGERTVLFEGEVAATSGAESLKSDRLTLHLNEDVRTVNRAVAQGDVDLRTSGSGSDLPPGAKVAGARGPRRLRCRNLEMWFRDDGSLLGATARPDAELEVLPAKGEPAERRVLKARRLDFGFDPQGRLERLEGRVDVSYRGEPIPPARANARSVSCQSLQAAVDPATGSVQTITFAEGVVFAQGRRRASGAKAVYDESRATLFLTEGPRVMDEDEGSDLRAETIDLGTQSGDVTARGNVRHQLAGKSGKGRGGLLARDEPVLLMARSLDYEAASRTARYREEALLRSGRDEVRAPLIVVEEPSPGQRRLSASGGVASVLNPRPASAEKRPPARVEARAKEMVYEEATSLVVYEHDVVLRQGDIVTKSPRATLHLTPDGTRVEKVVAGEPVEVRQGERTASGMRGTYTPENETLVLVGEKVTLKEPGKEVEGRSLTFQVGGRFRVDGREEVRTESVFRREAPRP